jgi:hypothetical protein
VLAALQAGIAGQLAVLDDAQPDRHRAVLRGCAEGAGQGAGGEAGRSSAAGDRGSGVSGRAAVCAGFPAER